MTSSLRPLKPGEQCKLVCQSCKKTFSGSYPGSGGLKLFRRTKCPFCNSRKVILCPGIYY